MLKLVLSALAPGSLFDLDAGIHTQRPSVQRTSPVPEALSTVPPRDVTPLFQQLENGPGMRLDPMRPAVTVLRLGPGPDTQRATATTSSGNVDAINLTVS